MTKSKNERLGLLGGLTVALLGAALLLTVLAASGVRMRVEDPITCSHADGAWFKGMCLVVPTP